MAKEFLMHMSPILDKFKNPYLDFPGDRDGNSPPAAQLLTEH